MIPPIDFFESLSSARARYVKTPKTKFRIVQIGEKKFIIEQKRRLWFGWLQLKRKVEGYYGYGWELAVFQTEGLATTCLQNNLDRDKKEKKEKVFKRIVVKEFTKEGISV